MLPEGFPGEWNYWMQAAQGRGTGGDHLRIDAVERITFFFAEGEPVRNPNRASTASKSNRPRSRSADWRAIQ